MASVEASGVPGLFGTKESGLADSKDPEKTKAHMRAKSVDVPH